MRANDSRGAREAAGPVPTRRTTLRSAAALAVIWVIAATACTGPALTTAAYESKAANTADELVSASRTVLLAAQVGDQGRSFPQTIAVTIANAETDAETARDAFASIQPPDVASDEIRAKLLPIVAHACDVIAEVRIAARRTEVGRLQQIAAPLDGLANDLEGLSERYR
jgi:hypothetical protein